MTEAVTIAEAAAKTPTETGAPMPSAAPPDVRASVAVAVIGRVVTGVTVWVVTGVAVIAGVVARHANANSHHYPRTRGSCRCHCRACSGACHQQGACCQFS